MFKSFNRGRVAAIVAAPAAFLGSVAHAAVPTEVSSGLTTLATDVATVGALIVGVTLAIMLFKWIRRAMA